MKHYLFLFCLIPSFLCFADKELGWEAHWANAVQACEKKDFENALTEFSLALTDEDVPAHVYVDRARLYMLIEHYPEALTDLEEALRNCNPLNAHDLPRAIVSKAYVDAALGHEEACLNGFKKLKRIIPNYPEYIWTKDCLIIRHVPDCECYQHIVASSLVLSGICECKNDIVFLPSGICIAHKKCACPHEEKQEMDAKGWRERLAVEALARCGEVLKMTPCQTGAMLGIDFIRKELYRHCFKNRQCARAFENVGTFSEEPCDPMWD